MFLILFLLICNLQIIFSESDISSIKDSIDRGYELLKESPYVKDVNLYEDDLDYLNSFPKDLYQKIITKFQGIFFVDNKQNCIKKSLIDNKGWEINISNELLKYLEKGKNALDIGSHIGTHTIKMASLLGEKGTVFAFEPNIKVFRELCYNIAINNIKNIIPIRAALGNDYEIIKVVTWDKNNEGSSYVASAYDSKYSAAKIRLDDLELEDICLIKIDVENMEKEVLEGARETIMRCRPVMIIEILDYHERSKVLKEDPIKLKKETINLIKSYDYVCKKIAGQDYLAIPKERIESFNKNK